MIENKKIDEVNYELRYISNGKVVGYISYEVLFETVNIVDVFVEEVYRKQGIASKLIKYLFDNVLFERVMLEVNENNLVARKLYDKFNFKVIHIRKKYYKDADALIMEAKK